MLLHFTFDRLVANGPRQRPTDIEPVSCRRTPSFDWPTSMTDGVAEFLRQKKEKEGSRPFFTLFALSTDKDNQKQDEIRAPNH